MVDLEHCYVLNNEMIFHDQVEGWKCIMNLWYPEVSGNIHKWREKAEEVKTKWICPTESPN